MNWLEVKPNLLRSECNAFTILRDERFTPPMFRVTKWSRDQVSAWVGRPDRPKVTLGRFDSLEQAQQACEEAA